MSHLPRSLMEPSPAEISGDYQSLSYAELSRLLGYRPRNKTQAAQLLAQRRPIQGNHPYQWILDDPDRAAKLLEVVPPPGIDPGQYLIDNLTDYIPVITRTQVEPLDFNQLVYLPHIRPILSQYTDEELLDQGIYVPYRSRYQLVDRLIRAIQGTGLFLIGDCLAYGSLIAYSCLSPTEVKSMLASPRPWSSGARSDDNLQILKTLAVALGYIPDTFPVSPGY